MAVPLYNPPVPFLGGIDGSMRPGKMVRIHGSVPHSADRFVVNLRCGPYDQHDIALHLSIRFPESVVVRNSLIDSRWGPEERFGGMPFSRGLGFELLILCDPNHFKIAVNGVHFTEYIHRTPYERVTHLQIHQDVQLSLIQWEGGSISAGAPLTPGFVIPPPGGGPPPPYPGHGGHPGYPGYVAPPGHLPQPPAYPGAPPGYAPPPPGCPPLPPGYSPQTLGYNQYPAHKSSGGLLDKAKYAIAGTLGTGGGHGPGTGSLLGAGLAGAALTGHLSPKKAAKSNKKAYKKALKYGLPIAGVGIGAYAAKKAFHGFHSSSSSSSSSSEEE
ncbi:galectin-4-like isoform X1 [Schistocerca nitens]|uniref:galectin-4-like isoform X1 n=1 Tax=Schistocerca nitens TaxID=7011 RepID=UPI0021191724|nr:galectin-4-like isoform X1 [Schistocerca nitens]XP_049812168.1 galectin-4-like isoform X1 [Schistocerca nitens]XP_049812169.1 galectin-4-like isoform X1 [Schistocerca nitens]